MSTPAPHTLQDTPGTPPAGTHRHAQALDALIEIGTGFARLLHAQALTEAAPQPPAPATANTLTTLAASFDRVARAVRRCIALAQRLDAAPPAHHRTAARKRILREVEDTINRTDEGEGPDTPAALRAELRDRLDAPDLEADLATRPVADIIKEICRDLGLAAHPGTRPFQRRTPADVARLCAAAASPPRSQPPANAPAAQPDPDPPDKPAPRAIHPGTLPADPAEALAAILRRHPQAVAPPRWGQPPGD